MISRLVPGWLLACGIAWGGERVTHTGQYTIENWQLEEGLPQVSVTSIAQTPDGYLWIGTFNGLARFDGVRFTIFNELNTPVLGGNGISHLHVDHEGTLWIVSHPGRLLCRRRGEFSPPLSEEVLCLVGDASPQAPVRREVLVLHRDGRTSVVRPDHLVPRTRADESDPDGTSRFAFSNHSHLWQVQGGQVRRAPSVPFEAQTAPEFADGRTTLLLHGASLAQSGGAWLATSNRVYRWDQGRLTPVVAPLPFPVTEGFPMQEDGAGTLWVAKWGAGLFHLEAEGSWRAIQIGSGLADDHVSCMYRDREGSLWVGTGQGGLHRVRPRICQMFEPAQGPKVVMSIAPSRDGRLWFGINGGGLHTFAEGQLRPVSEPAALRQSLLTYSVLVDRCESVWIGLYGMVALRWSGEAVTRFRLNADADTQVMTPAALYEDRQGSVWLGCARGLLRHQEGTFVRYTPREGLSCENVTSLAESRTGTLYVGTEGGGLNSLRDGRFTCYTRRDGLTDDHIACLRVDEDDTLWIGTVNGGLNRFRSGRFARAGLGDGLPSDTIGTIQPDLEGRLWLGTNRGIVGVDRTALNDYLDGKSDAVNWRILDLSDGLSTLGCTGGGQPASCRTSDGRLWFATLRGAAVLDPRQLPINRTPPPVVIEEVVLDDKTQALHRAEPVVVRSGTHRVEFRFTGLSLVAPEKVRFRFRLEPYDRDWVEAGTRRVAYYTGIPPGRYEFRVTACNNDGVWNETGTAVGLAVFPPWWNSTWFQAAAVLAGIGVVFGWYELRLLRLRRERVTQANFSRQLIAAQEQERQRLSGELHDEMGQDLLVIASQAQLSLAREQNSEGAALRLREIAETAKRALQHTRRMAHNLRPGLLDELGFVKAIQASAEKAARASGIAITVIPIDVDGMLPAEFEVNLFRITQEALNNILKHSAATEARIHLSHTPTSLRLTVEDNGRGFEVSRLDSTPARAGFGLRQMVERTRMMGGDVQVDTQPGTGTRLTIEVPLPVTRQP